MGAVFLGLRMAMPLHALAAGHDSGAVGVLMAMFAMGQLLIALPAGRISDTYSLRKVMLGATSTSTLAALICALYPHLAVLCVAAVMAGSGGGLTFIALQRHVSLVARNITELKAGYGWLSVAPSIANFVGPMIAGLIIDARGFQWAYGALAVFPIFALACVWHSGSASTPTPVARPRGSRTWDLMRHSDFRRLMFLNVLMSACWDVYTFLLPLIGHAHGLSASQIGSILAAFAVASGLARVAVSLLAGRMQERSVILGTMLAAVLGFALLPLQYTALGLGLISVILGFVLGTVNPTVMSALHPFMPAERQGEALGLRMMMINVSSVGMPLVFGALGAAVGLSAVCWGTGLAVVAALPAARKVKSG